MLPDRLHIVIGKTHIADIWSMIPDIALLNKTIPIKSPTERYRGMNSMLTNVETLIAFKILDSIEEKSLLLIIELMDGMRTMLMLPTIDIGTKSIGKVIPITTPKLAMAWVWEYPEIINIDGIMSVVRGWTIELASLTPVIGAALLIMFRYSPFLKFNFDFFKYIDMVIIAEARHVKVKARAVYLVAKK